MNPDEVSLTNYNGTSMTFSEFAKTLENTQDALDKFRNASYISSEIMAKWNQAISDLERATRSIPRQAVLGEWDSEPDEYACYDYSTVEATDQGETLEFSWTPYADETEVESYFRVMREDLEED